MTKKVAFVDIDGCLVKSGKLNLALVEQLKAYDAVILFTQRSKYLQSGVIPRLYQLADTPPSDTDIVTTPDAVNALSSLLKKPIKVSTSVDEYFGEPTAYYEEELKTYEVALKNALSSHTYQANPFHKERDQEIQAVREALDIQDVQRGAETFYPAGKIAQCRELMAFLPNLLKTREPIEVDFFDDSIQNLKEVMESNQEDLTQKPQCFVVSDSYICPVKTFCDKYGNDADPRARNVKKLLQDDTISKLCQYIADREAERMKSKGEYGGFWAGIFARNTRSATVKISAAKKAVKILQGEEGVILNPHELRALEQGRSKEYVGDAINIIKDQQPMRTRANWF